MPRERSVEDVLGAVRRMMRAGARRVAQADEFELAEYIALKQELDWCIGQAVAGQRIFGHKSWAQVGDGAGIRKSAAQERWGKVEFELWDWIWTELDNTDLPVGLVEAKEVVSAGPLPALGLPLIDTLLPDDQNDHDDSDDDGGEQGGEQHDSGLVHGGQSTR